MTILVIAIALALPAGLKVIVDNASSLSANWQSVADITVYLDLDIDNDRARAIVRDIDARDDVAETALIDRADALADFKSRSGFGSALDALEREPPTSHDRR